MPSCGSGTCFISYVGTLLEWESTTTITVSNSALAHGDSVEYIFDRQNAYKRVVGQVVIDGQTYFPKDPDLSATCCSEVIVSKSFVGAYQTFLQPNSTTGTIGGATPMWRNLTMAPSGASNDLSPSCTNFQLQNFAPIEGSVPIITSLLPSPCSILSSVSTLHPFPIIVTVDEAATSLYNTIGTASVSGRITYTYPYIPPISK